MRLSAQLVLAITWVAPLRDGLPTPAPALRAKAGVGIPSLAALLIALTACGAPQRVESAPVAPPVIAAEGPLDWATLLPIDTLGFLRIDLARLRRSPHRAAIEPLFTELLAEVDGDALRQGLTSVLERTDLVLIAMLPANEEGEDELLLLARGDYRADEIERLDASAEERSVAVDVRGQRVWISASGEDPTTIAQLEPDTLALTGTRANMEGLIARTRMASGSPRWPGSVRALVAELAIEEATIGLAIARQNLTGEGEDGGLFVALAGRADLDGPLVMDVAAELDDPSTAAMVAMIVEGMLSAMGRSDESLELRHLAELARVEASGTRVRAAVRADGETTGRLVPALLELFRRERSAGDAPMEP